MDQLRIDISGASAGDPVRAKWLMDGAETLAQAAAALRGQADYLDALSVAGWTLAAPVEDDYGFLVDPAGGTGRGGDDGDDEGPES